jgi:hypothetical protein
MTTSATFCMTSFMIHAEAIARTTNPATTSAAIVLA